MSKIRALGSLVVCGTVLLLCSGCSTLASIGLPFGSPAHQILDSAKGISDGPGQSLQMASELTKQPLETYLVEIGDTIFVEPVSFDATIRLPGDQDVKPDGTISIGEFGSFHAVNKTIDQIRGEIQEIIDRQIQDELEVEFADEQESANGLLDESFQLEDPVADETANVETLAKQREQRESFDRRVKERIKKNKVSVRLVSWDSKRIYVLGEVNSPGFFGYTGNQTVLDAIVEAGGMTGKANHHQVIVSRPTPCGSCRIVMQVCYDQIVQLGDSSTNYQLLPGDRVFVPSLTFMDDLKQSFSIKDTNCPRCAPCQQGCELPTGCQ